MTPSQTERLIAQLATVAADVSGLKAAVHDDGERRDRAFEMERAEAHLSRKEMHEKINDLAQDVGTLKGDVRVAAQTTAQTRDTVEGLTAAVNKAAPTIAQIEQAKRFGQWILGGGAVAAVGVALAVLAWGESIRAWLLHWLGIK